jgi:hypothetical protein
MSQPNLFTPDFASTHGCAWFEPSATGARDLGKCAGWASITGLPAFRFSSWRDLSPTVVWWTNLTRAEAWSVGRWDKIREGDLFGPDWSGWLAERASPEEMAQVPLVCAGISETFARAGCWLSDWSARHAQSRPWSWDGGSVADLLADRVGWRQEPAAGPALILEAAYLEDVRQLPPAQSLAGQRRLVLSFPRRAHAALLFKQRHPVGEWEMLDEGAWPRDPDRVAAWMLEQTQPLLLKTAHLGWLDSADTVGPLWLGSRGCRFAGAEREAIWMTGEEARVYSRHALFSIEGAYRAQGWGRTLAPEGFTLEDGENPLVDLALSQELLAAALWRAAASPTRDSSQRRRVACSPRAVWWRAVDRQRCFDAVRKLASSGYRSTWHGQGQVAVIFDPAGDPVELARAIVQAGLLLPGLLAKALPLPPDAMPDTTLSLDHWLKRVSSMEGRLDIDRLVAPWVGPTQVKPILQEAVRRLVDLPPHSPAWAASWKDKLQRQARHSVDRLKALSSRYP